MWPQRLHDNSLNKSVCGVTQKYDQTTRVRSDDNLQTSQASFFTFFFLSLCDSPSI